ncbi:MAG: aspartate aminotransferase family protein [Ignavibacteriae bacterium]|nr:MAG: aspartate aminotransferase family protein [Ignavibacteriota bacterium]
MELSKLIELEEMNFFHTYNRLNIKIDRGEGCYLYTDKNEKILDMFAGLAVNVLGYNHPKVNDAIEKQIKKYIHISNLFYQDSQVKLAEKIISLSGYKKIFFTNSGTEAIEAAIKLIRKYFYSQPKKEIISFTGAFHGRTMGALSLNGRDKYKRYFGPFLTDFKTLTFNSVDELEKNINENTAAVFLECIQGEGGINIITPQFVEALQSLREKYNFLIAADEIQAGVGRTGKLHSFEHFGLEPDIVILAKGIGGGLPLGSMLGNERVENVFDYGDHGSTFGGNPVAAAAGLAVFGEIEKGLMNNSGLMGEYLVKELKELQKSHAGKIKDIRGRGLMLGIEMNFECKDLIDDLMKNGVLTNCTNGNVIRLLPPMIMGKEEADLFLNKFEKVL